MKVYLTAFLCFVLFWGNAQTVEIASGTRGRVSFSYGMANEKGELAILLKIKKGYKAIFLDASLQKTGEAEFTLGQNLKYSFLGTRYHDDGFTFYFQGSKKFREKVIESYKIDKNTFEVVPGIASIELGADYKKWQHIFSDNNLYFFFMHAKEDVLKVLKSGDDGFLEKDFKVSSRLLSALSVSEQEYKPLLSLSSDGVIASSKSASLAQTYPKKKLYTYGDKAVISLEKYEGGYGTAIKVFDFEKGVVTHKSFLDSETKASSRNSFIKDGYVFSVQYTKDRVVMTIRDFETLEVLRVFDSKTGEGTLLIPEVLSREGFLSIMHRNRIKDNDQILNKLQKEVGAISVIEEPSRYLLTLGAYSEVNRSSGGGGFWDASGNFISAPVFYNEGSGATYYYTLVMDKTTLDITGQFKDARIVDVVLRRKEIAGELISVTKSKSIIQVGERNFILYQKTKDRNLYLEEVVY